MTARLLIFLFIFSSSCVGKLRIPDNVIKPEKMGSIMRDIIKADALAQEISQRDSTKDLRIVNIQLYNTVFAVHAITKEQFDKSYSFYEKNPSLLLTMFDTLSQRQIRANKAKDIKPTPDSSLK